MLCIVIPIGTSNVNSFQDSSQIAIPHWPTREPICLPHGAHCRQPPVAHKRNAHPATEGPSVVAPLGPSVSAPFGPIILGHCGLPTEGQYLLQYKCCKLTHKTLYWPEKHECKCMHHAKSVVFTSWRQTAPQLVQPFLHGHNRDTQHQDMHRLNSLSRAAR